MGTARSPAWTGLLTIVVLLVGACSRQSDISFFVLVKSSNYAQAADGRLTLLNYHFFSEIFLLPGGAVTSASLVRAGSEDVPLRYESRGESHYVEGGHFETQDEVDAAHPNGVYLFDITTPSVRLSDVPLRLESHDGTTDIPHPITISLWQGDAQVSPLGIDPALDLVIRWSDYSNGSADPRGIVDDMIFAVVADCHGERIVPSALPFQGDYLTFRTPELRIERNTLEPGRPYSAFVEFPHVVDSRVEKGVPGFTSYATATYLDLRTIGAADERCPEVLPPMDTGQTDR